MKKVLISLLLGVSMVTMAGCGNNSKEVTNTKVEENEREGAYPNFQDKETDEPIGLSKEEKEEMAVETFNNNFADVNESYNSRGLDGEMITFCYIKDGTIHVYNFMDYTKSNTCTNEEMAKVTAMCLDGELLNTELEISKVVVDEVKTSFKINGLNINDYEIRYHDCIGNPSDETFYELLVIDGNGNVVELLGKATN